MKKQCRPSWLTWLGALVRRLPESWRLRIGCECHHAEPYGWVIMAGCKYHD